MYLTRQPIRYNLTEISDLSRRAPVQGSRLPRANDNLLRPHTLCPDTHTL
jgi:hypothetical protein